MGGPIYMPSDRMLGKGVGVCMVDALRKEMTNARALPRTQQQRRLARRAAARGGVLL